MEPPAPPGRRKWVQYISIHVIRDPAQSRNVRPNTTGGRPITLSCMPSVFRGAIAALLLACLTAFARRAPVASPVRHRSLDRAVARPSHALSRDAAGRRLQAAAPGHARQRACDAVARHGRAMADPASSAALPAGPAEPLVDTLGTGGLREIHLRPFLASGGTPDSLLNAFVRTAQEARATRPSWHAPSRRCDR